MDRLITATEANQRFSELLRDVAAGESFTVTSRGRPVARIAPHETASQAQAVDHWLDIVRDWPIRVVGPWTREELYD